MAHDLPVRFPVWFSGHTMLFVLLGKWETTKCPPNLLWDCTDWKRERNKVQSLIQILRKHHTFGTLRVRWDNKRALWGMWQANQRGCSSIRQGIDVYMYISIGKRLFGVCVFLAESEKWNIARYLPISLRYSHEKRLSNKYCAVCCAACWQTRRGNCNRMLIKLVRIIYVWYVRSII